MPAFKWPKHFPINVDLVTLTLVLKPLLCIVAATSVPMKFGKPRQEGLGTRKCLLRDVSFLISLIFGVVLIIFSFLFYTPCHPVAETASIIYKLCTAVSYLKGKLVKL